MKNILFVILGILLLAAIGNYFYKKFIVKPKIKAQIYLNEILVNKKIPYIIDYSGVKFSGVYDLNKKEIQTQTSGNLEIKTYKNGLIFGINILKDKKIQQTFLFDLATQKLIIEF